MIDISILEQRLAVALRRISVATEALSIDLDMGDVTSSVDPIQAVNPSSNIIAVGAELDEAQSFLTSATLKIVEQDEKIAVLNQALEDSRENLATLMLVEVDKCNLLADAVAALEVALSQVTQSNKQLREANQKLRDANAEGLGNSALINFGLQSEVDSLKVERAAEKAQLNVLITGLSEVPLINVAGEIDDA